MKPTHWLSHWICFCVLLLTVQSAGAKTAHDETITIACSANFKLTLEKLLTKFESLHPIKASIITASSGVLFTQIKQGAPFDIFLSADALRPRLLETSTSQTSFSYALGKLVFWQPGNSRVNKESFLAFNGKLAIANPKIAPYGIAAMEILQALKPDFVMPEKRKLIRGNNVIQSFQFVISGNVAAGLVSLSQTLNREKDKSDYWIIPREFYSAIEQRGILLNSDKPAALLFTRFLKSDIAASIIVDSGYDLPKKAVTKFESQASDD